MTCEIIHLPRVPDVAQQASTGRPLPRTGGVSPPPADPAQIFEVVECGGCAPPVLVETGSIHDHGMLAESLAEYDHALIGFRGVERATLALYAQACGWTEDRGDLIEWSRRRVSHFKGLMSGCGRQIDDAVGSDVSCNRDDPRSVQLHVSPGA